MSGPMINISDVVLEPTQPPFAPSGPTAERFEARQGMISERIGARKLGYNITAVPPGKRAWPIHHHRVNEEMFFVLEGSGEVRIGDSRYPIRRGDFIACPAGGRDTAHQIINTGTEELRYLAVSTQSSPEVVEYPDSGKFAVNVELGIAPDGKRQRFIFVGRESLSLEYWEGE